MINWFTVVQIIIATIVGVVCVAAGLARRRPADLTIGGVLLVEALLLVQMVVALVAPAVGNPASGSVLEFWVYLVSAALLPPVAVLWALVERDRWSTVVMGVAALAIAIMVYRMSQIWYLQGS